MVCMVMASVVPIAIFLPCTNVRLFYIPDNRYFNPIPIITESYKIIKISKFIAIIRFNYEQNVRYDVNKPIL